MQIANKAKLHGEEKEEEAIWAKKFIEDSQMGQARERAATEARRKIAQDNNGKLLNQIAVRKEMEEKEKQEIYLDNKHMKHIEKQHRDKLAEQGGNVRGFRPLKKSQWYT
jgi:hypothetical protein